MHGHLFTASVGLFLGASSYLEAQERQVVFGDFTTGNGTRISVEEDFMNGRYPRHFIFFANENGTERDGTLILRCENNKTELFFASGPFDFFGFGIKPSVQARFPSDDVPTSLKTSSSSDGEAAFLSAPIEFISRLVEEGSVGLAGSYYAGSFRHRIAVDTQTKRAIYDLAETCEWKDQLPALTEQIAAEASAIDAEEVKVSDVLEKVRNLVEEYGVDAVWAGLENIDFGEFQTEK